MKKIVFVLAMFFCPSLYAATLTANTVPYVCQGGTSPQLCNSDITTDSNGNVLKIQGNGLGSWTTESSNTVYHATTDGLVLAYDYNASNVPNHVLYGLTDSNNPPLTLRTQGASGSALAVYSWNITMPVRKGDYWEVIGGINGSNTNPTVYWISLGS